MDKLEPWQACVIGALVGGTLDSLLLAIERLGIDMNEAVACIDRAADWLMADVDLMNHVSR